MDEARDAAILISARAERLRGVMRASGVGAVLSADPINIVYGCGVRNMTVFSLMGPFRFILLFTDGPTVIYDFVGCEHLAEGAPGVDRVRPAPGLTPTSGSKDSIRP